MSWQWKRPRFIFIFLSATAFAGVCLLLLPSAASWFSQAIYSKEIQSLSLNAKSIQPESRLVELQKANVYNSGLIGSVQVAANSNKPLSTINREDLVYEEILAADDEGLMARIKIPKINVDLPVYHGTSDRTLEMGAGHLQGSALPVGGINTHSVLTAHRGLAKAELFTHLDRVQKGDRFTIEVFGETLTYQVFDTKIVDPEDTQSLFPIIGRDLVTLVTCTPLGVNSHRILVTAERISPTPIEDILASGEPPQIPGFPWWALWFVLATFAIVFYLVSNSRQKVAETTRYPLLK